MHVLTALGTIMVLLCFYEVTDGTNVIQEICIKMGVPHRESVGYLEAYNPPERPVNSDESDATETGSSPIAITSSPTVLLGDTTLPAATTMGLTTSTSTQQPTTTSETHTTTSQPPTTTTQSPTTTTETPTTTTQSPTTSTQPPTTTTQIPTTTTQAPTTSTQPSTTTTQIPRNPRIAEGLDVPFNESTIGECSTESVACSTESQDEECKNNTDCPLLHLCCQYSCGNKCVAPVNNFFTKTSANECSLGFMIDTWFNTYSPQTLGDIVTSAWDYIRWSPSPLSVNVMMRSFSITRTDPAERDLCRLYRQLETLHFDFPALHLRYWPFAKQYSALYIITGSNSHKFFKHATILKRIFELLCYVVVDDTPLENYHSVATQTSDGPCVLTLDQLSTHSFPSEAPCQRSEELPSRPNCGRRGSICSDDTDCGTLAFTCSADTCQVPDCSAFQAKLHPRCDQEAGSDLYLCDYSTTGKISLVISELMKHPNFPFSSAIPNNVPGCCDDDQVLCHEFPLRCIEGVKMCDGNVDCLTGEDEHPSICESRQCREDQFHCTSGQCIPRYQRCDTISQCSDGSDEIECATVTCIFSPAFQCNSGQCVPEIYRCDGRTQCVDGSDEADCDNI